MGDKPTRLMDDPRDPHGTKPAVPRDPVGREETVLQVPELAPGTKPYASDSKEPVVGWLVIVNGPGKGRSLTLGHGINDIARSSEARIPLNFGDNEIAREK